jgi:hypothetical protein
LQRWRVIVRENSGSYFFYSYPIRTLENLIIVIIKKENEEIKKERFIRKNKSNERSEEL